VFIRLAGRVAMIQVWTIRTDMRRNARWLLRPTALTLKD